MKINTDKLEIFYIENYKKLLILPIILTIIALVLIGLKWSNTGDFMNKDVSLRGGITATIDTEQEINIDDLKMSIPVESTVRRLADPTTGKQVGIIIEVSDLNLEELKKILEEQLKIELTEMNFSAEETGPTLGQTFYNDLMKAILIAFVLMGIVVLIAFRNLAPTLAIIFAAFADIIITLAIVNIMGINISASGIVAFLLLIGYSVDSDVLLTTRVLKSNEGSLFSRIIKAAKTGLTMSVTTLVVLIVSFFFSTSPVLKQMFLILFIGLLVDVFTTYLTNTGILFWYRTAKR